MHRSVLGLVLAVLSALLGCEQPGDVVAHSIAPLDTGGGGGVGGAAGATINSGGSGGASGASGANAGMGGLTGGMSAQSGGVGGADTGGTGAVMSGGTGGSDQQSTCDTTLVVAIARLSNVARDCTFDIRDPQTVWLLWENVFRHPPVRLDPEAGPPDVECNRLSNPPDELARVRMLSSDGTTWLICPAYCAALVQWIDANESALQGCSLDGGI